jgi:hypothetical protein
MSLPAALLAIRWLVRDTFRQSLASRIFWVMLLVTAVSIVFCLGTSLRDLPARPVAEVPERITPEEARKVSPFELSKSGVDVIAGEVVLGFGAVRVPWNRYRDDAVRWLQLVLAGGIADTAGLLLALIWTAAFLPTFLEPEAASVLLAKPVPRWSLLAGKYLGVLAFVAMQVSLFVAGTWLALAVRTGVWAPDYLACIPLVLLHFAVFFSFSTLLAVWTRSTIVCVFGALLFWVLCWGMNYGRHAALAALADQAALTQSFSWALELGYWVLPKPADFGMVLFDALGAGDYFPHPVDFARVEQMGALHLGTSVLASCLFAVAALALAGYEFVQTDY